MSTRTPQMRRISWSLTAALVLGTLSCGDDGGEATAPTATTGSIRVSASTTGDNADPDGYTVTVDGETQSLDPNGSVTFSGLDDGSYSVELAGVAANCTVGGDNPRAVTVTAGQTAETTFEVTCTGLTGAVEVVTASTGSDIDPDGYMVSLDGGSAQSIGVNATLTFDDVAVGDHTVELTDVAGNCTVAGDNPRTVSVTAGATASIQFDVSCQAVGGAEQISFTSRRDGDGEIYSMNTDGTDQVNLTNHADQDGHSAWSPDGSRLAFHSDRTGNFDIYLVNPDGTGLTNVTNSGPNDFNPAWSPDGNQLAFAAPWTGGGIEVTLINIDGTGVTNLTQHSSDDNNPDWSPDGAQIAFSSLRDGNSEIYVMNADGSNVTRLTNDAGTDDDPDWSPDGTELLFYSDRDGNAEIFLMNSDGSGVTQLTVTGSVVQNFDPEWSPDGTQIAFESDRDEDGNREIYTMSADGSGVTRLTNAPDDDTDPSWGSTSGSPIAGWGPAARSSRGPNARPGCRVLRTGLDSYAWGCR